MSKNKKSKKEKKKQKQLEQVKKDEIKYDLLYLLKTEQLDTKPNVAKFLNAYVSDIHVAISNCKVQYYPTFKFTISKIFVRFLDGHELIYFVKNTLPESQQYFMYFNLDEHELKPKEVELVKKFFEQIIAFKFVEVDNN